MKILRILPALAVLAVISTVNVSGWSCVRLGDDLSGRCGQSDCSVICVSPPVMSTAFLPGFTLEQSATKLVVSTVLPNSPAGRMGLKPGDQVLSVDGSDFPLGGDKARVWQSKRSHMLSIRRASYVFTLQIQSLPAVAGLTAALGYNGGLKRVSLANDAEENILLAPYVSGLVLTEHSGSIVVDRVLECSPAEIAGIRAGDRVVSPVVPSSKLITWERSYYRAPIRLSVARGAKVRRVTFQMISVTQLLENAQRAQSLRQAKAGF